jgi:hypothetical protein
MFGVLDWYALIGHWILSMHSQSAGPYAMITW